MSVFLLHLCCFPVFFLRFSAQRLGSAAASPSGSRWSSWESCPLSQQRGSSLALRSAGGRAEEEKAESLSHAGCYMLEELTQRHWCSNPTGAKLLPGNLWADSNQPSSSLSVWDASDSLQDAGKKHKLCLSLWTQNCIARTEGGASSWETSRWFTCGWNLPWVCPAGCSWSWASNCSAGQK